MYFLSTLVFFGIFSASVYSAPLEGEAYVLSHEVVDGSEVREEDIVVDPKDNKIVVFNWNKEGYDVTGNMESVLDYDKNVGVVVVPRRRQCMLIDNLAEVLPKETAIKVAGSNGQDKHGVLLARTGLVSEEEKQNIPEGSRDLCSQWPVYKLEPRGFGRNSRDAGRRVKRGCFLCILHWG